jgi:hypothetical protein
VWSDALDAWGIDALLDCFHAEMGADAPLRRWGVIGAFQTVPYKPRGSSDVTRAYASERVSWL